MVRVDCSVHCLGIKLKIKNIQDSGNRSKVALLPSKKYVRLLLFKLLIDSCPSVRILIGFVGKIHVHSCIVLVLVFKI